MVDRFLGHKFKLKHLYPLYCDYFFFINLLGICLYVSQLGVVGPRGYDHPLNGYSYIIGAGFICWISRGIEKTPYIREEHKTSKKIINNLLGIALVAALLGVINAGVTLTINQDPESITKLFYIPDFYIIVEREILIDWVQAIGFIFGVPLVLTVFGEGLIFTGLRWCKKANFLFAWEGSLKDEDITRLRSLLTKDLKLEWAASAEIIKKANECEISIKKGERHVKITIEKGEKAFLEIPGSGRKWELRTKKENNKLCVYRCLDGVKIHDKVA